MKIKPFDRGFFAISNAIFDVMMPDLSANGFKVLCATVRQTLGWNRDDDVISYTQFQEKTGIKSTATISRAISENVEKGYLIRTNAGRHPGTGKPLYSYRLNTALEIEVDATSKSEVATSKSEVAPTSKSEVAPTSKSEVTTIHIHDINNTCADDGETLPTELNQQLDEIGLNGRARKEIQCWNPDDVEILLQHATEAENPAAWLAAWVINKWDVERLGNPAPTTPPDQEQLCEQCRETGGYISTGSGWTPCTCWSKTKEVRHGRD